MPLSRLSLTVLTLFGSLNAYADDATRILRIGVNAKPDDAPELIAKDENFFADHQIDY